MRGRPDPPARHYATARVRLTVWTGKCNLQVPQQDDLLTLNTANTA